MKKLFLPFYIISYFFISHHAISMDDENNKIKHKEKRKINETIIKNRGFNPRDEEKIENLLGKVQFDYEREAFYRGKLLSEVSLPKECTKPLVKDKEQVIFSLLSSNTGKNNKKIKHTLGKREKKEIEKKEFKEDEYELKIDGPESILGDIDRRKLIRTPYKYPYSVHGHMRMKFHEESVYIGSGTLVGGKYVITAGHNLYAPEEDQVVEEVTFFPGRNGEEDIFWKSKADMIAIHPDWYNYGSKDSDIGLIKLKDSLGYQAGYIELVDFKQEEGLKQVSVTGYPGNPGGGFDMYSMSGNIMSFTENRLFYDIDTSPGQSGSGVWYENEMGYSCVAVHTYGGSSKTGNSGTIINKEKLEKINKWKMEFKKLK